MESVPAKSPKNRCVALTCLRDDGSYILEWLAHHIPCGFDHFVILSHDCTDGSQDLLDALAASGIVTHVPFRHTQKVSAQWQALKLASKLREVAEADWLMFFDLDEFLWLPPSLPTLRHLLQSFHELNGPMDGVAVPWCLFGNAGARARGPELTPERFTASAPPDLHFPMGHLFKSLLRPAQFGKLGIHRPRKPSASGPPCWIGPDGSRLPEVFGRQDARISLYGTPRPGDLIGLNHYSLRSVEEFMVKRQRGLPNHMTKRIGLDYWVERNWNTITNRRILPMMEATLRAFNDLLGLPGVRTAHDRCMAAFATRAARATQSVDDLRLTWQISLLSENRPPDAVAAADYIGQQIMLTDQTRRGG